MRITLNLATRPFTDIGPAIKRLRIGMAVLAVLCLLFVIGLHLFDSQAADARASEHSLDGAIARIEAERQQAQAFMRQPDNAQLLNQAEFLNERFDEKAFSWTLAMEAMETVLPAGVQVTTIDPKPREGKIEVDIRVVGPHDQSVNLVRNLERSRRFIAPRIENESAENSTGPNQRIEAPSASNRFEFELVADYNPPTPEERVTLKNVSAQNSATNSRQRSPGTATPQPPRIFHPLPTQPGRPPYTGPAHTASKPSPATHGGPQ
jgi:type IV pilus assembly protein PilN